MKALCLSGGGCKGAFQVGVLRHLLNVENVDYDICAGISVGALNSAMLSTGKIENTLPKLENIWFKEINGNSSIWKHNLWYYILISIVLISLFIILAFVSFIIALPKIVTIVLSLISVGLFYLPYYFLNNSKSVYNTDPLKKLIDKNLDLEALRMSGKHLRVGAVSFTSGKYRSVDEYNENIKDWIIASSAFPIFFPMVEIDGDYWTDGGLVEISPLEDVIKLGADEIDVILTSPIDISNFDGEPGLIKQFHRHIDIMSSEILKNDLSARVSLVPGIKIRVFCPEKQLISNSLEFDPAKIKRMYDEGIRVAEKTLSR